MWMEVFMLVGEMALAIRLLAKRGKVLRAIAREIGVLHNTVRHHPQVPSDAAAPFAMAQARLSNVANFSVTLADIGLLNAEAQDESQGNVVLVLPAPSLRDISALI
jgi:hypothetical protein